MAGVVEYATNNHPFNYFLKVQENWDQFLKDGSRNFSWGPWFDLLPKQGFPLYSGEFQQTGIWRPAPVAMTGLVDWRDITTSRATGTNGAGDAGVNACSDYSAKEVEFGNYEIWRNSGKEYMLKSPPICVTDLVTTTQVQTQLAFMVKHMLKLTKEVHTTWHREQYIRSTMFSKRSFVMTTGGVGYGAGMGDIEGGIRWYYDAYDGDANGDTYMYFPAGTDVSTLRWEYLQFQREYLQYACPEGAMARADGEAKYMALGSRSDFQKMVDSDPVIREDYRYAHAQLLVEDYTKFTEYRGVMIAEDPGQMRFDHGIIETVAGSTVSDGSGGYIPAGDYVKCKRLNPERRGRAIMNGAYVTEVNPDYIKAPYRILPIMMKNVLTCQIPDVVGDLGSGITFGVGPSYNGEFKWVVIEDSDDNPFGEKGNFFSRYKFYLKPDDYYLETTAFLYASCYLEPVVLCDNAGTDTTAVALSVAAAEADASYTNRTIDVTLAKSIAAGDGSAVSVTGPDASGAITGYVMDSSRAPTYSIGFSATELAKIDTPAAVTTDATFANAFTTSVTVQVK